MNELDLLKRDVDAFAGQPPPDGFFDGLAEKALAAAEVERQSSRQRWGGVSLVVAAVAVFGVWSAMTDGVDSTPISPEMLFGSEQDVARPDALPGDRKSVAARAGGTEASGHDARDPVDAPLRPREVAPTPSVQKAQEAIPGWRSLSDAGKFSEAISVAKAVGLDGLVARASADDLLALGEAANYSGNSSVAWQAFSALRHRHAHSAEAGAATFHLARISARRGKVRQALGFLDDYLNQRPGGHLAREARGLRLELLVRTSDSRSTSAARGYLKHHPDGPHSVLAARVAKNP